MPVSYDRGDTSVFLKMKEMESEKSYIKTDLGRWD